jgi:cbb3-type cytochrome oxidase subunit 3
VPTDALQAAFSAFTAIVALLSVYGCWHALRRAERREAWERTRQEARASRLLSERKDMRALATWTPEMNR